MTDLNRVDSGNLDAIRASDGVVIPANIKIPSGGNVTALGVTLAANTTYFFPFGAQRSPVPAEVPLVGVQVAWDAAIIATITPETCLFPATLQGGDPRGPVVLTDYDVTAGLWLLQAPPTAYVPIVGGTVSVTTATVPGGSRGGCEYDMGNLGARRGRIKVVVGATGGVLRVGVHGKAAA